MKKLLVLLVLMPLLMCGIMAQTVHYTDQATVEWEPVTERVDDTPIAAEDVVEYELYRTPYPTPIIPLKNNQ